MRSWLGWCRIARRLTATWSSGTVRNRKHGLRLRRALQFRSCGISWLQGNVAKRTIERHILAVRPPGDGQTWKTFLANRTVWACDFLQLHDVWFRPLFAFFVVDVNTKEVVHAGVTREPNEAWTAQQLRQLTPFGEGPELIIRDRDAWAPIPERERST